MILIGKNDVDLMIEHARQKLPEEACGLVAGTMRGKEKDIKKIYLLTNTEHSDEHFFIDPKEHLDAVRDMRKRGFMPLGNWHSHPKSPSEPSEEDKKLAYDSKASYMILSLMNPEKPVLRSFRIENHVSKKEELKIMPE